MQQSLNRSTETNTILIVDDRPANLAVLSNYLEQNGHRVLVASSGERALERLERAQVSLILLDIQLPGIDGFETCRRIKCRPSWADIPVLFLTAYTDMEHKIRGFDVGGVDYITKPLQREEVLARVNTHLRLRNLTLTLDEQYRELEKLHRRREMSRHISRRIASILGLKPLLSEVTSSIQCDFEYDFVGIWLLESDTGMLELRACSCIDDAIRSPCAALNPSDRGDDPVLHTYRSQGMWVEENMSPRANEQVVCDRTALTGVRSRMALPLCIGLEIDGVIDIQSRESSTFTPEDRTTLQALSSQIAIAVRNAKLYRALEQFNQHLEVEVAERTRDLHRACRRLEHVDLAKSEFIQLVSHELRTPMNGVYGCAQLLRDELAMMRPATRELLEGVLQGASEMRRVVELILDATRIDSGVMELEKTRIAILPLIDELIQEMSPTLAKRRIDVTLEGITDSLYVDADARLLKKAFLHLVANAIKYTPNGGHIRVGFRPLENKAGQSMVEFVVQDNGIGIAHDQLELIFEKFYQTGRTTLRSSDNLSFKSGGAGLGLAIAKGIIVAHGGDVWAESVGHDEVHCPGSQFHIRLPQVASDARYSIESATTVAW